MRWSLPLVLVAASALAACAGQAERADRPSPPARATPTPDPVDRVATLARPVEPPPVRAGQVPPAGPYAPGFDALHYDIAVTLPDSGTFIRGSTTAVIGVAAPRRDTLALDFTGLAVERVRVDGRVVGFRHEAGKLHVPVPPAAGPGDTIRVAIDYSGDPDDGLILRTNVHGARTAFADNWPDRARFWFPSIDHPSDKATVAFTVDAPEPWTVVANGEAPEGGTPAPSASAAGADRKTWSWATTAPIPTYTMVIGAAEFAVGRAGRGCAPAGKAADRGAGARRCIETTWWAFPPDTAHAARVFGRADEMVAYYDSLIAPFPYEKLANVQSSTRFGGMENAGAIFYSERAIAQRRDIEPTVAHEIAHQWFGDAVTESDWSHLWLSEGFATYFGALFFEHADGVDRFREMLESNRQAYLRSEVQDRPIVDPAPADLFALLNANSYQKGGWVLHMLRGVLGDSVFFDGVRRYYREHEHGTALTADLRRAMEAASGVELGWFFTQWLDRPGHPRFRLAWSWSGRDGVARVSIEQVQPEAWPVFTMPVTLDLETARGPVRRTVQVDERIERIDLRLPAEPTAVRLDPEGWILKEIVTGS